MPKMWTHFTKVFWGKWKSERDTNRQNERKNERFWGGFAMPDNGNSSKIEWNGIGCE